MSVRPPRPRRPARRPNRVRDLPIIVGVALALTAFWLRSLMALFDVAEWLAAWRLIDGMTSPVIAFLQLLPVFERSIIARLTVADVVATLAITFGAFFCLASLSIRRAAP